jgi:hypothetical protein
LAVAEYASAAGAALWSFNSLSRHHQISDDVLREVLGELDLSEEGYSFSAG